MTGRVSALTLSASLIVLSLNPALAIEPDAAAEALGAAMAAGTRGTSSFESAAKTGDNIEITGLTLVSSDSGDKIRFERTVIESPSEGGEGVFQSPRISVENGTISGKGTGSVASAMLTDATILDVAQADPDNFGRSLLFSHAEASGIVLDPEDQDGQVSVSRVSVDAMNWVQNEPQDVSGSVEDMTISESTFAKADFKPSALGYGDLVFDINFDVSRDPETQMMDVRDFTVAMQDGGSLTVTGEIGKVPDPAAFRKAERASVAMMEIQDLTLTIKDASLTGKILDFQAGKQGITREQYAQQIAGALPFLLAALNNQQFQNQVATAVGTFLQNPQTLTVTLDPAEPVSGAEIVQTVKTAPQTLPDKLNATIIAK